MRSCESLPGHFFHRFGQRLHSEIDRVESWVTGCMVPGCMSQPYGMNPKGRRIRMCVACGVHFQSCAGVHLRPAAPDWRRPPRWSAASRNSSARRAAAAASWAGTLHLGRALLLHFSGGSPTSRLLGAPPDRSNTPSPDVHTLSRGLPGGAHKSNGHVIDG